MNEGLSVDSRNQASGGMIETATTRAAQEVQAAMVIAKKFPRNAEQSLQRIKASCERVKLAEKAVYSFPRGVSRVTGPSIRLAEVVAQNWGNLDCGIIELERLPGKSIAMAYAWDLETNTRDTKIFEVPHTRDTRQGPVKLEDSRDIYELVANMGARRKRACILAVIPGDIIEEAEEVCRKTLSSGHKEPLIDRLRKMADVFKQNWNVSVKQIEARLGHNLEATTEDELVDLRSVFNSLKDGMAKPAQYFGDAASEDISEPKATKPAKKSAAAKKAAPKDEKPKNPEPEQPELSDQAEESSSDDDPRSVYDVFTETFEDVLDDARAWFIKNELMAKTGGFRDVDPDELQNFIDNPDDFRAAISK